MEVGGLTYVADVMNHVDRSTERDIFDELNLKNPQLAEDVRKLMFVFEDIAYLDPLSIQRFLRETDSKDLAVALKVSKGCNECNFCQYVQPYERIHTERHGVPA